MQQPAEEPRVAAQRSTGRGGQREQQRPEQHERVRAGGLLCRDQHSVAGLLGTAVGVGAGLVAVGSTTAAATICVAVGVAVGGIEVGVAVGGTDVGVALAPPSQRPSAWVARPSARAAPQSGSVAPSSPLVAVGEAESPGQGLTERAARSACASAAAASGSACLWGEVASAWAGPASLLAERACSSAGPVCRSASAARRWGCRWAAWLRSRGVRWRKRGRRVGWRLRHRGKGRRGVTARRRRRSLTGVARRLIHHRRVVWSRMTGYRCCPTMNCRYLLSTGCSWYRPGLLPCPSQLAGCGGRRWRCADDGLL